MPMQTQILNKKLLYRTTPLMIPQFHFLHLKFLLIKNFVLILLLFFPILQYIEAMRVHPMATKRNIDIRDNPDFNSIQMERNAHKKLKKLPHVFSKVLELPFSSDADVVVEEGPDFFRFVAEIKVENSDAGAGDVRAHAVEIHPGIIKIVVRNNGRGDMELDLDKLEVDMWRFRLPSGSRPELATASFVDDELIVTVPKGSGLRDFVDGRDDWGNGSQLVLVQ